MKDYNEICLRFAPERFYLDYPSNDNENAFDLVSWVARAYALSKMTVIYERP